MHILLRKALIRDASSPFNGSVKDILIQEGLIFNIADTLEAPTARTIDLNGGSVSIGWVDVFADFADPGHEHREDLTSGSQAAAAGGFTRVFLVPNTSPALHTKSQVEYIIQKSKELPVHLHPLAAVTRNTEGKELAEMYDMLSSGAIAFSDGFHPIQSAGLLIKALQYVKAVNGIVIQLPDDRSINSGGLMHEGIISTQMGLPGKPALAEELMIARDIELTAYTESRLHFVGISAKGSVDRIREAKKRGVKVTCSVTPYHLFFCDGDLQTYDTNLKVNPPLRSQADRKALLDGIADGTIDMIATHHQPQNWDGKTCEFEYAKYGMIGLESCFSILRTVGLDEEKCISLLVTKPRQIFQIPGSTIQPGNKAELTIFHPNEEYPFTENLIRSRSRNSAFIGKKLKGKVLGIVNKDGLYLND